jgi:hypothetical protein
MKAVHRSIFVLLVLCAASLTLASVSAAGLLLMTPTVTPKVTDTPTPVPTLVPLGQITSGGGVNVRSGPGTGYEIVTTLSPDTRVSVLDQSADGAWYKIRLEDGQEGWISTSLLTVIGTPTPTPAPADLIAKAQTLIGRNIDWYPLVQTFDSVEMVLVPAGCFTMGNDSSSDSRPTRRICFDKPFWIDRNEMQTTGHIPYEVNWVKATEWCQNRDARLPTEAEWEYAARGPSNWIYPWGNTFIRDNVSSDVGRVGTKPAGASWVGALDMIGNAVEWTSSLFWNYPYRADDGRENPDDLVNPRVVRGSAYGNARADNRNFSNHPTTETAGFRCVRDFDG